MSDNALYLVNLSFSSNNLGGGSMKLALTVDPVRNTLNGGASGTILEGTEHTPSFTASGTGHIHATGLGNITQVGAISGPAVVSFPPPLIGSYEAPFSASFAVDSTWKGTGKFSVGNDTYECQVERISY